MIKVIEKFVTKFLSANNILILFRYGNSIGDQLLMTGVANLIKKISGFSGSLYFNKNYPDGVKKRKLDSSKINKLGWKPKVFLNDGLKKYYNYYTRIKA